MTPRAARLRTLAVLAVVLAVVAVFLVRLIDVQLVSAHAISAEAEGRRGVTATEWGERGRILASDGTVLADTVDRFDITASPRNATGFERADAAGQTTNVTFDEAIRELAEATGLQEDALRQSLADALEADPDSNFAYLARMVPLDVYEKAKALKVPWLYFERHPARTYPNGAIGGNLTGFLGADGSPLAGLELGSNDCLAGADGEVMYDRSSDGIPIPGSEVTVKPSRAGGDLVLSIDPDLQWYAQQVLATEVARLGSASAHATIMDAKTGQILALAEAPAVDPNNPGLTDAAMRGSRAFTSPFEPGSTMKPFTAAMAFDRGLSTPGEAFDVPDTAQGEGYDFHDDSPHEIEHLTTAGIIEVSSNVGISMVGSRLSAEDRYDYLSSVGLGQPTEAGFLGEESGTLHPWQDWDPQTNFATMFGQGLTVTAPQMASIYQTLANGGVRQPVSLIDGCRAADGTMTPITTGQARQVVSAQAAADALSTIEATAQSGGNRTRVAIPGYRVGIKTGTAQYAGPDGTYEHGRYIISMAGVAPIDDPRFVVTVTFEPPATMSGSYNTAPTWHDLMAYALQSRNVPPSPEPWPQIPVKP